jgi:hypothetical protein
MSTTALQTTPVLKTSPVAAFDHLAAVRAIAKLMDSAFVLPGTRFRVGLDSIIGLFPVVGDLVGVLVSGYIVSVAARSGVPRTVLARMMLNVGIDAVGGAVPLVGDVFDAAWKANLRNVALLEQAVADPARARRSSRWMIAGLLAVLFAVVAGAVAAGVFLVRLVTG